MKSFPLTCTICKAPYIGPVDEYVCTYCGGSIESPIDLSSHENLKEVIRRGSQNGIWDYRPLFPVAEDVEPLSLGEGNTPLIQAKRLGEKWGFNNLLIKNESLNPTGTYKDRFATIALSLEKATGTKAVALGSAGNAAAAVAAYAAIAEIPCYVVLPSAAVKERAMQVQSYGAKFIRADADINECIQMVVDGQQEFGWKVVCTTMLHQPYASEGYKSISYEIARQMNFEVPDYIICPVGGAILLSKIYRGYTEMLELGLIERIPKLIAVQAEGCAPLVKAFKEGASKTEIWENGQTIAFAINDARTFEGVTGLDVLKKSEGFAETVNDDEILEAMRKCASTESILAEPASAAALACAKKLLDNGRINKNDSIVCIVTGSALRDLALLAGDPHQPKTIQCGNREDMRKAVEFYDVSKVK